MFKLLPLALVLSGCAASNDRPANSGKRLSTGPSVLLITLDTTRADRLGPWGYELATTPTYDRLAREGTVFSRAYSSCPLTIPSHSTIFTGRYPPSHGVRDNGDYVLGDGAITLAERFSDAGYYTAAFTSAFPTQARWGFAQGFDTYHDPLKRLPNQLDWRDQRRADEVVDDALETLKKAPKDKPVFTWVHLFDAHWPYEPPEPYLSMHPGRPYDGEIAYTDSEVGRLLAWWEERYPNQIVLITADHGEGLGDGGEQTHGFLLHDPTMHVPFLLAGTGIPEGKVIDDPIGLVDVAPTLLNLTGLPLHPEIQGKDAFEGGSDQIYAEAMTAQFNLGLKPLYSYTEKSGRYMEGAWGGYYLFEPPRVSWVPATIDGANHAEALTALRDSLEEVIAPDATLGIDEFEMLAALGYTEGTPTSVSSDVDPRDVIDKIPLTWAARQALSRRQMAKAEQLITELERAMPDTYGVKFLRAQLMAKQGRIVDALLAYEALFESTQGSNLAMQIAGIYSTLNMWRDAEKYFQKAIEFQSNNAQAMAGVVRAARELKENEKAKDLADQFLYMYPDHAELALLRAEMLLADDQPAAAAIDAKLALEKMPFSPWAYTTHAQAQWEMGNPDPAIEALFDALKLNPLNHHVRLRLAECLLEVGRNAESTRIAAPLSRLLPDDETAQDVYRRARAALEAERTKRK